MIGYTILSIKTMMLYHHVTIDCIQGTFHEYLAISFRGFMQQKTSMYGCIYIYTYNWDSNGTQTVKPMKYMGL